MGDKARNIARVICVVVIVACLCVLGFIGFTYFKSSASYEELRQFKTEPVTADTSNEEKTLAAMTVDWNALQSRNADSVAWITVNGTNIDYPVVQADDNELYLHQGFDGSWSANGTIFLDAADPADFSARNCLLYGHHMRDGSMFASLAALADQGKFDQCDTAHLLAPTKSMLLRPIALVDVSGDDTQIQERPESDEDMLEYVKHVLDRAVCKADGVDPAKIKQTVGLVTCDELSNNGRYVLVCSVELSVSVG